MGANFDIVLDGSYIGGLTVGQYTRTSSSSSVPISFSIVPDTVQLPCSYIVVSAESEERFWNGVAYEYIEEGAYYTYEHEPSYHRLVKLTDDIWLCAFIDIDATDLTTPSKLTGIHIVAENTTNHTYTDLFGSMLLEEETTISATGVSSANYFFLYKELNATDTPAVLSTVSFAIGAYTIDDAIMDNGFFIKEASNPPGVIGRLRPNQVIDLPYLIGSRIDETTNILSSVGNAGSAAFEAISDTIDLP